MSDAPAKVDEVIERERAFYDEYWTSTEPQAIIDKLVLPVHTDLKDKKILICSCGTGIEPVLAANAGAVVYTFDLSKTAVQKAQQVAEFNNVQIQAHVMNFHHLEYPENFFDVVYGSSILHHVDCGLVGKELRRVLKSGGVAAFWENSDRNPIIRWFRRKFFGTPGGSQKQKFLFMKRHGTTDEYPLTDEEVAALGKSFGSEAQILYGGFVFFGLLADHVHPSLRRLTSFLDRIVVRISPGAWKYSFWQWVVLRRP